MSEDPFVASQGLSPFIADQRIYVLKPIGGGRVSLKKALELESLPEFSALEQSASGLRRDAHGPQDWQPIYSAEDRSRFLEQLGGEDARSSKSPQRRLLCITSSAGIGKSIALQQAAYLRSQLDHHIVIQFHFEEFPSSVQAFWGEVGSNGVGRSVFDQMQGFMADELAIADVTTPDSGGIPESYHSGIKEWLVRRMGAGQVTLFVDGLDELDRDDGVPRALAIRDLLRKYPRLHCMVAGRPFAIVDSLWNALFKESIDRGMGDDANSAWCFGCVAMFNEKQNEVALGPERFAQLKNLSHRFQLTPRTIEVLRGLSQEQFGKVETLADVYWESFQGVSKKDVQRKDKGLSLGPAGIDIDRYLEYVSALAWTMHRKNSRRQSYAAIEVEVLERLQLLSRWRTATPDYLEGIRDKVRSCNAGMIEFHFFDLFDAQVSWRSATLRDFFAALWLVRYSSPEQREEAAARIPKLFSFPKEKSIHPDSQELWTFLCGMSPSAMGPTKDGWGELVSRVFRPCPERPRPTELMAVAWPRLKKMSEDLSSPLCAVAGKVMEDFLAEFVGLQQSIDAKKIIERDLRFSKVIPEEGKSLDVMVGHRDEEDNQPRSITLDERYSVSIYPCTQALYRLFDPAHDKHFSEFFEILASDDPRRPAIGVTFWDAEMFAIWSGSRLLTEWEWEYACRAECKDSSGNPSKYYWPDDDQGVRLQEFAWTRESSTGQTQPVGGLQPNAFGIHDMLGNVWEWTNSHYENSDVNRVMRGGSLYSYGRQASASCRHHYGPTGTSIDYGLRLARAPTRKP